MDEPRYFFSVGGPTITEMLVMITANLSSRGEGPASSTARVRAALEEVTKDPRVTACWGLLGAGSAICLLADVERVEEAERIAAFLRQAAPLETRVLPLVGARQFLAGLRDAERVASVNSRRPAA